MKPLAAGRDARGTGDSAAENWGKREPQPGGRPRRTPAYPYVFWSLVAFSLVALVLGAWLVVQDQTNSAQANSAPAPAKSTAGRPAEPAAAVDFALTSTDGKQVRLSELRGKTVLLNFWATWCPPCKAEMPDLQAIYRENGDRHNFVVLAVDVEEQPDVVRDFVRQYGLSFPVLPDSDGRVSSNRYFIRTLPTSFIIDPSGNVRYQWSGQLPRETMLARLAQVW